MVSDVFTIGQELGDVVLEYLCVFGVLGQKGYLVYMGALSSLYTCHCGTIIDINQEQVSLYMCPGQQQGNNVKEVLEFIGNMVLVVIKITTNAFTQMQIQVSQHI